jgi:hypothetical protein
MKNYIVTETRPILAVYFHEVKANSEEEALEKVHRGESEVIECGLAEDEVSGSFKYRVDEDKDEE